MSDLDDKFPETGPDVDHIHRRETSPKKKNFSRRRMPHGESTKSVAQEKWHRRSVKAALLEISSLAVPLAPISHRPKQPEPQVRDEILVFAGPVTKEALHCPKGLMIA
jgi:hypothetical protein